MATSGAMPVGTRQDGARQDGAARPVRLREAVGVFDDVDCLDGAVSDLQQSGFSRSDLSIAAGVRAMETLHGRGYTHVREIEDDPDVPRMVFVSKASLGDAEGVLIAVAVYLGAVVAAILAAQAGAGTVGIILSVAITAAVTGLIGYVLSRRLDRYYRTLYREQARRGGCVLWINLHSQEQEYRAMEILRNCHARDIHVHEVPVC